MAAAKEIVQLKLRREDQGKVEVTEQMDWDSEKYGFCVTIERCSTTQEADPLWIGTWQPAFLCHVSLKKMEVLRLVDFPGNNLMLYEIKRCEEFVICKVTYDDKFKHRRVIALEADDFHRDKDMGDAAVRVLSPVLKSSKCSQNFLAEGAFVLFYNDHNKMESKSVEEIRRMEKITGWSLKLTQGLPDYTDLTVSK